jgi:hypothetical protein
MGSLVVLIAYTLAAIPLDQFNLERFLALFIGALLCSLVGGCVAAAIVRSRVVVMVVLAQLITILILVIVWNR